MTRTNEPDFFLPERGALCAVSGGLDSMCLLTMAVQWGQAQGRRVAAAHFNHQLRGGDADRDERFVRDWCAAHAIPFFAGRGDVRAKAEREGLSVEEAARTLRYAFLEEVRQREGFDCILTAHHADDSAETMLLNLLRGTGLRGLTGIPPVRGRIRRPLLGMTRAELADTQNSLKNQLDSVAWRLMDVQDQITDLSLRQREQTEDLSDFSFEPTGLDPESHTLQADMSITLRRWTADTEVALLITQNGQTAELPMTGTDGVFATPVGLPVEDTGEVSFAANITAGGQTSREEVTSYSDLAVLLPLSNDSSGYGDPTYRGGSFQLQYDLGIRKQYGTEVIVPVFQVLKNGETVQTLPAKISESTFSGDPDVIYYTPASDDGNIEVSCQPKDTIELHLLCRDSFGLSYDFTVCTYEIDQDGTMAEEVWPVTDHNVRVSWEK